ncbi:MAG: beta-lactamase family protein [Victivallales bacterium]|jgi:CubicO group peptidase (beta-lactamase class C family)|nr:beta-lactamase family protein [Victivallales bacterium]
MEAGIERVEEAMARVRELLADGTYPCAVVGVSQDGNTKVCCLDATGNEDQSLCNRPFLLASITKPIVSAAVAVLVAEGKLAYDTRLAEFFPAMRGTASEGVEVGDIFTHTTGFCTGVEIIDPKQFTPETYYRSVLERGPSYAHREAMAYSTMTYHFVNAFVPMLTGVSLPDFLAQRVFGPLGMTGTSFYPPADTRMPVRNLDVSFPGRSVEEYCRSELSGAGLWSTVDDLLAFGRAHLTPGELLSEETITATTTVRHAVPMLNQVVKSARTFGWNKQPRFPGQPEAAFGHGGATGTLLSVDPSSDLVFVLLTNHWACPSDLAASALARLYT